MLSGTLVQKDLPRHGTETLKTNNSAGGVLLTSCAAREQYLHSPLHLNRDLSVNRNHTALKKSSPLKFIRDILKENKSKTKTKMTDWQRAMNRKAV